MTKTVAKVGRKGGAKNQGGEEAKEAASPGALAETLEEVEATTATTATAATATDCRIEGFVEGVAVGALAANSPVDNQPVVVIQDQVGVDPSWSAAAKESCKWNEERLAGVNLKLLHGVLDAHNLCKMAEFDIELELNRCHQEQKDWKIMIKPLL
jgi:hypothetical protein